MKSIIIILIFSLTFLNCTELKHSSKKVVKKDLEIKQFQIAIDSASSESNVIKITITNKSESVFSLWNSNYISLTERFEFPFSLEVICLKTGKRKIEPFIRLVDFEYPTKKDYQILKPNESYELQYKLDFTYLINMEEVVSKPNLKINTDYGNYQIKAIYFDKFHIHRFAIKDTLESNSLAIEYISNYN